MTEPTTTPVHDDDPARALEILGRPFGEDLIRNRPGSHGQTIRYVEGAEYVKRMIEAFGLDWSFEIVQHQVLEHEVLVLGRLRARNFVRMAFGGTSITSAKETNEPVSLSDDLKAAATDAMKKAASFLGIGLHLYENGAKNAAPKNPENGNPAPKGNGTAPKNGNGRLTSRQLDAIMAIGKDHGLDREAIKKMSVERFGKNVEFVSKAEASSLIQELSAAQ